MDEITYLSEESRAIVRTRLELDHSYFYHFTLDKRLERITRLGIHPGFESEDSSHGDRSREPAKAMRYCIQSKLDLGLRTARTRALVWDESAGCLRPGDAQVVLLRTKQTSLLGRSFGLDHSFGNADADAERLLQSKAHLTPEEFIDLINYYGAISCYEPIPPAELELCVGSVDQFCKSLDNEFRPLLSE